MFVAVYFLFENNSSNNNKTFNNGDFPARISDRFPLGKPAGAGEEWPVILQVGLLLPLRNLSRDAHAPVVRGSLSFSPRPFLTETCHWKHQTRCHQSETRERRGVERVHRLVRTRIHNLSIGLASRVLTT